jgi:hypothetical protein
VPGYIAAYHDGQEPTTREKRFRQTARFKN